MFLLGLLVYQFQKVLRNIILLLRRAIEKYIVTILTYERVCHNIKPVVLTIISVLKNFLGILLIFSNNDTNNRSNCNYNLYSLISIFVVYDISSTLS